MVQLNARGAQDMYETYPGLTGSHSTPDPMMGFDPAM